MKLQNFESDMSDVIIANVQNNGALVFFACFFYFMEKEPFSFMIVFNILHELMKLRNFERLSSGST